jgi:hypothetical protein
LSHKEMVVYKLTDSPCPNGHPSPDPHLAEHRAGVEQHVQHRVVGEVAQLGNAVQGDGRQAPVHARLPRVERGVPRNGQHLLHNKFTITVQLR